MPPQMQNQAQSTPYAFSGGLDQASASLAVPGGRVIAGLNYEPTVNGYQRVQGHERFDGRRPSDYHASRLNYSASGAGIRAGARRLRVQRHRLCRARQCRSDAGAAVQGDGRGWVQQTFGGCMRFVEGLVEIAEGATITGGPPARPRTSSASSSRTASGARLLRRPGFRQPRPLRPGRHFTTGETIKVGATNSATNDVGGDSTAITLPPGGRYVFKVKNFYGATNRRRVYGVNGVGTAFEYDGGSVLVPIETGTPTDTPERIFDIANHLGLTFPGGSIQVGTRASRACSTRSSARRDWHGRRHHRRRRRQRQRGRVLRQGEGRVLTGRDVETFVFEEITDEAGALAWTAQRIGRTVYLDRRGMRDLRATAAFGNFKAGALSELFDRFLEAKRRAGALPVASLRCKPSRSTGCITTTGRASPSHGQARRPRCCRSRPTR
jgi:hypothetical protein